MAGLLAVGERGLFFQVESMMLDLRFRLRPVRPASAPVVIIGIDNASISQLGRWPWSRVVFARLLDRLAAAGAKVVAFDLLFTEPQSSPFAGERRAINRRLRRCCRSCRRRSKRNSKPR